MTYANHRLLKDLALEFKREKSPKIFKEIVTKVDRLLFKTIHKARRNRPYLKKVDFLDLYQDAVIGLYQALNTVKDDEPGSKVIYRIVRYAYNEIGKNNKKSNKVTFPFSIADVAFQVHLYCSDMSRSAKFISEIENTLVEQKPVYAALELECIRDRLSKLIEEGIISTEEFIMICMHHVNGKTYTYIANQFGTSYSTVSRKVKKALNRLRFEFRKRNWEGI